MQGDLSTQWMGKSVVMFSYSFINLLEVSIDIEVFESKCIYKYGFGCLHYLVKMLETEDSLPWCIWVLPTKLNGETGNTGTLQDLEAEIGRSRILMLLVGQFFKLQ